ncbi:MAG: hypothetical protein IK104_06085 [Clostridia bacterium]|nr:hypothetical protein [Clostridia bacterium]
MKGIRLIDVNRVADCMPDAPRTDFAFADCVYPRFIQVLRKLGKTGVLFTDPLADPGEDLPRLCILEDIDCSKVLAYRSSLPVIRSRFDALPLIRRAREEAEDAEYPVILFYAEALLEDDGGMPFLRGVADGDADVRFSDPDGYFRELTEIMPDLPLVRLDPKKKYAVPASAPDAIRLDDEGPTTFLPAENIMYGPYLPYTVSAPNVRPSILSKVQLSEGRTLLILIETEGKETECDVICEAQDFAFRALFAPYEMKVFSVDTATGRVTETDLRDVPEE